MKKILLLICYLLVLSASWALNAPQLRCLEVKENGDVLVSWQAPSDISGFARYEIYYATESTDQFALVGTVTSSTTTQYLHAGANAVVKPHCFYYVRAVGSGSNYDSETLSTIEFYLSNSNGLAVLNWSAPTESEMPSYVSEYDIQKAYPLGNWAHLADVSGLIFRDTIDVCDASIGYRVELADNSGCKNVSRVQTERFTDMTAPAIPVLDSVSVLQTSQQVALGWEPSSSPDAFAYIIYFFENNVWIPIDTVWGINNTQWIDTEHSPDGQIRNYRIATLDSCLNSSPMTDLQKTMTLSTSYDLCRREAYLSWTEYENMRNGMGGYKVFCKKDAGSQQFVADVQGTSYTYPNLTANSSYEFVIQAVNSDGSITASSVKSSFVFSSADNHDFVYVKSVSVTESSDAIQVTAFTGPTVSFTKVHLYRSVGDALHFARIQTLSNNGTDTYSFTDNDVDCEHQLYYYKATIENECDMETAESNVSHNIVLQGTTNPAHLNTLTWNTYEGWNGSVSNYVLKRLSETSVFESDVVVTHSQSERDDVSALTNEGSVFTYSVVAYETTDEYGFTAESRSNKVGLVQSPTIYVPNAFCPTGINAIFLPVTTFMPTDEYYLAIFGRDGTCIFYTKDPNEGWDGTRDGQMALTGVYVYKIKYRYEGKYYEKSGTVTLVN